MHPTGEILTVISRFTPSDFFAIFFRLSSPSDGYINAHRFSSLTFSPSVPLPTSNPTEETMKKSGVILVLLASVLLCASAFAGGNHRNRGHYRDSDGDGYKETYVAPHRSTNPDSSPRNNYNYPGNYNPNSGTITPGNPDTYERNHRPKNSLGW